MIEISDLLVDRDPVTGQRNAVSRDAVVQRLLDLGDRRAAEIVRRLPASDGLLPDASVDQLLIAVHCEIQRLSEEFRHGARMAALLAPILAALRTSGLPGPYRIVDIGCGTGYVVRWLSRNAPHDDVEYVGVDFNDALVREATRLADEERLSCHFATADAFHLGEPAHILLSTGVLHHFPAAELSPFFANHEASGALGFVHVDFQPSRIAPFGAWMFHRARMRLAVSRNDGIRSAQRAHPPEVIAAAARHSATSFQTWILGRRVRGTPLPCVLTSVIGVHRSLAPDVVRAFGRRARNLAAIP